MVEGLNIFRERLRGLEDCYVLIGGTACDLWMSEHALDFRATKDLDVVLVAEALRPAFFRSFWQLVKDAGYEGFRAGEKARNAYRFHKRQTAGFPYMIELFTRRALNTPSDFKLSRVPAGENLSSLSAILLDEDYYRLVLDSRRISDGVSTIPAGCLIPLKARACLDLIARKAAADKGVKEDDIKKHRNDVFRLLVTLALGDRFVLSPVVRGHLQQFARSFPADANEWPAIRQSVRNLPHPAAMLQQLNDVFMLGTA